MNALRIVVPPPLAEKLREHKVADEKINQTVADALWKLVEAPAIPPRLLNETTNEYFRRIILEMSGGVPPSLDEPFVNGMTTGEFLALSDEEQEKLWNKWHEEAWEEIEKQYLRGVDVKSHPAGQKRGTQVARRANERRAEYRTRRRRTKRT